MTLEFRPLHGDFAAEVIGAPPDLRVDDAAFRAIEAAWYRHSILIFRDLDMTPQDHVAFTRRLGPLHIMVPSDFNLPERPEEERFVYRHHWLQGDGVLWDNRCAQHCATPFDEARYTRLMHRTTLEGDAPVMA
jgi:alpha-ketoglutarate-dependent taurine dioxygenase